MPLFAFFGVACPQSSEPSAPDVPDPIGPQLLAVEGTWAFPGCASSRMYWDQRQVQYQCFDAAGVFSWENRGALSQAGLATLEAELANADLDATSPVDHKGLCGGPDSGGEITMWVGEEQVSFAPYCLFEGIVPLHDHVMAIWAEIDACDPGPVFESFEPGCRPY